MAAAIIVALAVVACGPPRLSESACALRTLAHSTAIDLTALVKAVAGSDQSTVVAVRASLMDDGARLSSAVAADGDLSEAQQILLGSEINLATQAASFVSVVPVVTDQASIDRLRDAVARIGSDLDREFPLDTSCG
jgi:hypothetical protein